MKRSDITDEQVVRACVAAHEGSPFGPISLDVLIAETGAPRRVAEAAMTRAMGRGWTECGVSERTSWATPAGRALLGTGSTPEAGPAKPIRGEDYGPGCGRPDCTCEQPGVPCEEWMGLAETGRWCPRCGWARRHHPDTTQEAGSG